jgi:hypothetical protein
MTAAKTTNGIKIVFSAAGGIGPFNYYLNSIPSGQSISGTALASGSSVGSGSASVYTGYLGGSASCMTASTTFSGDVTLVFGPLVTVFQDG